MPGRWGAVRDLLLRRSGLAGLLITVGGVVTTLAVASAWHVARAELEMLGAAEARVVTSVAGWQMGWAWAAALAGLVATFLGAALALDRHPGWTRPATIAAGAVALVSGVVPLVWLPRLDRFPDADGSLRDLREVAEALPVGVELTLSVGAGAGPFLVVGGALAILIGVVSARELDTR